MTHDSSRPTPPAAEHLTAQSSSAATSQTEGQPFVHDARIVLWAPSFVASRSDGDLESAVDGFYHGDRRYLRSLHVTVDGVRLAATNAVTEAADRALFEAVLRQVGQSTADPAVTLRRERSVAPARFTELIEVTNHGSQQVACTLRVSARADFAAMDAVKAGARPATVPAACEGSGLAWTAGGDRLTLTAGDATADGATSDDATIGADGDEGTLLFPLSLAPGQTWRRVLTARAESGTPTPFAPVAATERPWDTLEVSCADADFARLLSQSEQDLSRLLLADPEAPGDLFAAAGAPWFLTLFGRDSLWTARMLLPLGTGLAAGTLRTLARRQGRATVAATEEQPGKILHEVRAEQQALAGGTRLPPRYFGTIDATPLWISLLHDAWRWGLPDAEVAALLPNLEAALSWLTEYGDPDGDGLLEYIDATGTGLANQGWKDSGDSIRFRDGSQAKAPIALCEVQAYAHQAALAGADLLDAFGRPGAPATATGPPTSSRRSAAASGWPTSTAATPPSHSTPTSARWTRSLRAWATCWAPACSTPPRAAWSPTACCTRGWRTATACAPTPPGTAATTRSATTSAASGRTTPRSPCTAWPGPASPTTPADWPSP